MSGNPVKKPAVVRDHYRAAGKILQALFKRPKCININIVGGFIQKQDVGLFLKRHGQMQAIALSSRKRTTFFFLIGTGKIKTRQKSTHVDVTSPHPYGFITARSEEHTSELQSRPHLVCRLLLEKKNK